MKHKYITPYADEWFSGPPPSVGWWPAGRSCNPRVIRWHDGRNWSDYAHPEMDKTMVGKVALTLDCAPGIKWAKRWWEKAEHA